MSGHDVAAPDGTKWQVRRRIAPRLGQHSLWGRIRARYKKIVRGSGNLAEGMGDTAGCIPDAVSELGFVLIVLAVVALLALVVVPLIVVVIDLLVVALLTFLGLLARVMLRRPWTVEASSDDGITVKTKVVGWRASGEERAAIIQRLNAGMDPLLPRHRDEPLAQPPTRPPPPVSPGN